MRRNAERRLPPAYDNSKLELVLGIRYYLMPVRQREKQYLIPNI